MDCPEKKAPRRAPRRWLGPGAWIALGTFLLGRLALEPLRDAPHFDRMGMDAYSATETYSLRENPSPVKVAFFGSSQSLWAILADDVARETGLKPEEVRNLASEGGTPFDMWNMLRRNGEHLKDLRLAVVEVNPFVLRQSLDDDWRVQTDIYQRATLEERFLLSHKANRTGQVAEWLLPIRSVRHTLNSTFLNWIDPEPGCPVFPAPGVRTQPAADWFANHHPSLAGKERMNLSAETAAKRMVGNWRLSKLQDHSLRQSLAWFEARRVRVIFHELPVHPEVVALMWENPSYHEGHDKFLRYVEGLQPPPLSRIYTPDPADCGVRLEHMADRTHINENGAHVYSKHMAVKISQFLPELDGLGLEPSHAGTERAAGR